MSIGDTGRSWRYLSDPIYLNNKKISQIYLGNKLVYPEDTDIFVGGCGSVVFNNKVYLFNVDTKPDRKPRNDGVFSQPSEGAFKKCISYDGSVFKYEFQTPNLYVGNPGTQGGVTWRTQPFVYNGNVYLANGGCTGTTAERQSARLYRKSGVSWDEIRIPPYLEFKPTPIPVHYQVDGYSPVVHNGCVYFIGTGLNINYQPYGTCSYKWDGSSWSFIEAFGDITIWCGSRSTVSYKGNMYCIPNGGGVLYHGFYKTSDCTSFEWIDLPNDLGTNSTWGAIHEPQPVTYNGLLYIPLCSRTSRPRRIWYLCEWDGSTWLNRYEWPDYCNPYESTMCVFNNKIYVFGGGGEYKSGYSDVPPIQPEASKMLHTWDPQNGWVRLPNMKLS